MFKSIVVGTDGSETAKGAVRQSGELARALGAQLHVVSAYHPASGARIQSGGAWVPERAEWTISRDVEVESVLGEAAGSLRATGTDVETHARTGDPAGAIIDVAEEQSADLIVVGSKGMQGTRRFLLGSVPDKISHHAPCCVMIIRTS
jgi:nucleotide-binding universal stress UspA family protein